MPKIDFKHFKMFTDISQKESKEVDVTFIFANRLYSGCNGLIAHDIAHRVYKSDGPVEFTKEELDALKPAIGELFAPIFQDSFQANIVAD